MYLTVSVKPVNATLLPNFMLCRNVIKCFRLEQSVPIALVDIVRDIVPSIILIKGMIEALDSDGICSMISIVEIPEIIE